MVGFSAIHVIRWLCFVSIQYEVLTKEKKKQQVYTYETLMSEVLKLVTEGLESWDTCGLICSEDAFAGCNDALGDFLQLLLLLRAECWVLVRHDACWSKQPERDRQEEEQTEVGERQTEGTVRERQMG